MPLGNHTSQFFANVYLNELDQFAKHKLRAKYYIRYVDDFAILSNSKLELKKYKKDINDFLINNLKLTLHPDKSKIHNLKDGINFLGFRIFYYNKLPRKTNYRKFETKFKVLKTLYKEKQINRENVVECLEGWMAYAKHSNTYKYRRNLLRNFNKSFPITHKSQIIRSKKIKNFFRKVYASKTEFSVQKTLRLFLKGLSINEITKSREVKESTIWSHLENLIEHGQVPVWKVLPRDKIVFILHRIKSSSETLKEIKQRVARKSISFDEIACVRAYMKMKAKIPKSNN